MKKIFPIAMIALFGIVLYSSCEKHKTLGETHLCRCAYKNINGDDSTIKTYGYSAIFSTDKAAIQCANHQAELEKTYPAIVCKLDE